MGESKCREAGCQGTIVWAKTEGGKLIPLDKESVVYILDVGTGKAILVVGYYVSHFRTCRNPSRFSRGKLEDPAPKAAP